MVINPPARIPVDEWRMGTSHRRGGQKMTRVLYQWGSSHPLLVSAFSQRPKNMSLVYGDTGRALKNREEFLGSLKIDYRDLVCARQVHGSKVSCVTALDRGRGALLADEAIPDTDALLTNECGVPLAVFTADCLSIFLYDAPTKSIGIVHAGWRSSKAEIAVRALRLMQASYGVRAENVQAGFGPAIRGCCYEVGDELCDIFPHEVRRRNSRYYLELAAVNRKQLRDAGVKENHITDSGICTSCRQKDFFSYRREGEACGRMMSVIMLR